MRLLKRDYVSKYFAVALCIATSVFFNAPFAQDEKDVQAATFSYTGQPQRFVVPGGVAKLYIEMAGASGGLSYGHSTLYGAPGLGGKTVASIPVLPGQILWIYAGGQGGSGTVDEAGNGGFNGGADGGLITGNYTGGGGGGSSDIRIGNGTLKDRIMVAGGGGASGKYGAGGNGGGLQASDGYGDGDYALGGGQQKGGMSGNYYYTFFAQNGCFGHGGSSSSGANGGGGGGGWYGGGGGAFGDGGGGSSFVYTYASGIVHTPGYNEGNGWVSVKWKKADETEPVVSR